MLSFRFRGRQERLRALCEVLHNQGALPTVIIAKRTGLGLTEANQLLEETPELFVRLPSREGKRYRLTLGMSTRSIAELQGVIDGKARTELLVLSAITLTTLLAAMVIALGLLSWSSMGSNTPETRSGHPEIDTLAITDSSHIDYSCLNIFQQLIASCASKARSSFSGR